MDRVEEDGSCDGLVQGDEEEKSAFNDRNLQLDDLWMGSRDETNGQGRGDDERFNE